MSTQIQITPETGITIGTTPISSGTDGRILFEGSGNVVQQDSDLFWDNTNKSLGVGATPSSSVRLDVRLQGGLSTDVGIRVMDSINTHPLFQLNGIGNTIIRSAQNSTKFLSIGVVGGGTFRDAFVFTSNILNFANRTWTFDAGTNGNIEGFIFKNDLTGNNQGKFTIQANNYCFGTEILSAEGVITERRVLRIANGVAPTTSKTDEFKFYSADIVAGNAAPHFRTENGSVVKLYRQDLPTNPTTAEIATFLSNLGLANLV